MEQSLKIKFIFTVEHAGRETPSGMAEACGIKEPQLLSHRGFDEGALQAAVMLSGLFPGSKVFSFPWTRLLIDANRNPKTALQARSAKLSASQKQFLLKAYKEYRNSVYDFLDSTFESRPADRMVIVSVHSFTPVLKGKVRPTELGLLYRPQKFFEKKFANILRQSLVQNLKFSWVTHFNRPYLGSTDCFLNDVLDRYPQCAGVFLEFNQRVLLDKSGRGRNLRQFAIALRKSSERHFVG